MKIAIVHDFLKEYGGAERVVEALHDIWPDAPVFTSFVDYNSLGPHAKRIRKWNIIESPFGKTWLMRKFHSPLRFLAPLVWRGFDFTKYDVVISSSGWYISRGITVKKPTVHICYLHHPPRHLYGYQTAREWQKHWPVRVYGHVVNHFLRIYDFETAQKVDYFIANSEETRRRIAKFYRGDSVVIYPPVTISKSEFLNSKQLPDNPITQLPHSYFLTVSRLARAKHIDILIDACQNLGKNLVIVGKGREKENLDLRIKNKNSIIMLGEVSDEELNQLYENAKAFLFAGEDEEFGIAPVEAMAHGLSVIAYRSGGVAETIIDGKTGKFFNELNGNSLGDAIKQFEKTENSFTKNACVAQSKKFSKEVFERKIRAFIENKK